MLRRYVDISDYLWQFFVSNGWEELGLDRKPWILEMKEFVNDRDMRQAAIELLKLLEPIYEVLRYVETRVYTAGDFYTDLYILKVQLERACNNLNYILKADKMNMTDDEARTLRTTRVMQCLSSKWEAIIKNELHGSAILLHPCTPASKWQDPKLRERLMDLVAK